MPTRTSVPVKILIRSVMISPARYTVVAAGDQGSDGLALRRNEISDPALEANKLGMYALLNADLFNLLCIPPHKLSSDPDQTAASGC